MTVLATAGHVDHGKSTLVRVLTGIDPDRLAEEKARGLTIDLGFAWLALPSERRVAIVDVPGHIRFLRNMLAGVGGVDGVIFVVDATEGWMPQSEEHLRIIELLGLTRGIVAMTKVALADPDVAELARLEVMERLESSPLRGAPVLGVDSLAGVGLNELQRAIDTLVDEITRESVSGRARMWIDRAFSPTGTGTVVTGTLTGAGLSVGETVRLDPGNIEARIRGMQSMGEACDEAPAASRVALNLAGIDRSAIGRGHVVTRPDEWLFTRVVDASLDVLPSLDHEVSRRGAHLAYIGAAEASVPVRVLGADALAPGTTGSVRMHLPDGLPLQPGDRFILRESGRSETVGGGQILDIDPVLRASWAAPDRSVDRVVVERGWVTAERLLLLTGEHREPDLGRWVAAPGVLDAFLADLVAQVEAAGPLGLDLAQFDERERAGIDAADGITVREGRVVVGGADDGLSDHPWLPALAEEPFAPPPPPEDLSGDELREMGRRGLVIAVDGVLFSPAAMDRAATVVAELLAADETGFTVAQARDALGTSRKFVLPILNHLDATGRTRRRGDLRIAGPRLPVL